MQEKKRRLWRDHFSLRPSRVPILATCGMWNVWCREVFADTHLLCEDLGRKIDMLHQLKNLRSIAVTPVADVKKCAEQIGADYAISWRSNPTDMVCCSYNENLIRRIISGGLRACRGGHPHIHLKDIETVESDLSRLTRWVKLVREIAAKVW